MLRVLEKIVPKYTVKIDNGQGQEVAQMFRKAARELRAKNKKKPSRIDKAANVAD